MRATETESRPPGSADLSVVIPSYRSVRWMESTLASLSDSIVRSPFRTEVVVVDDGSADGTAELVTEIAQTFPVPLRVVVQDNRGRFLARWTGAAHAVGPMLLLLDSRVLLGPDALAHVADVQRSDPGSTVWNAHISTDPSSPLVGRFWEVPTSLFWNEYLSRPRAMTITPANFDRVPTGTTAFLLPTELFREACRAEWPDDGVTLVSDDVRLLRWIVAREPIRLDPEFDAVYRPRVRVRAFLRHSFDRGTLFVDSYAGTGALRNAALIVLAVAPPALVAVLIVGISTGQWLPSLVVVVIAVALLLLPVAIAAFRRVPGRAIASYLVYVAPFGVVFWAGIVRGIVMHRAAFARSRRGVGST